MAIFAPVARTSGRAVRRVLIALAFAFGLCGLLGIVDGARAMEQDAMPAEQGMPATGVIIRDLQFSGDTWLLSTTERSALVAEAVGQRFDFAGLQNLADRTTFALHSKGHILARAYLPPQDVTDGVLQIALIDGTVEAWEFEQSAAVQQRSGHIDALAVAAAAPGQSVTRQKLERALLLMGDHGGTIARARLESGTDPNTARLIVALDKGAPVAGNWSFDNYGSRSTGLWQSTLGVTARDTLYYGETVGFSANVSRGTNTLRINAHMPLGGMGWQLGGQGTWMQYHVVEGDGVAADLTGRSHSWQLELSYPFMRSRQTNVNGKLIHRQKTSTDFALGVITGEGIVTTTDFVIGGDFSSAAGLGGHTTWQVQYTTGLVDLLSGVNIGDTGGRFDKATLMLRRVQRLRPPWTLVAGAAGQWAGKNLDSSEKFSLGGPAGVRAYPSGEGSGDLGWRASLELRYDMALSKLPGHMQWTAFVDHGRTRLHHTPVGAIANMSGQNEYSLSGAGLSLAWHLPPHANIQIGWAHTLGENPGATIFGTHADGTTSADRLWVHVGLPF